MEIKFKNPDFPSKIVKAEVYNYCPISSPIPCASQEIIFQALSEFGFMVIYYYKNQNQHLQIFWKDDYFWIHQDLLII